MELSRRDFLKISGASTTGLALKELGFDAASVYAAVAPLRITNAKKTTTICPYCAVGCGIIVYSVNGKVVYTEGDPDHPINRGSLCSKGSSVYQLSANNPAREKKPLYRAHNSSEWKEVSWDWALDKIAERVYKTREKTLMFKNTKGQTVNRTNAIASVGSAAMDNEECYIYRKFLTALGLVYVEHQARI
jgi:formate dehydrogenase major subunit